MNYFELLHYVELYLLLRTWYFYNFKRIVLYWDSVWRSLWIAADFNDILVQHNISKSLALSHTRLDRLLLRQKFSVEGIQNSQAQQQRVLRGPQHCWPLIGQAGVITLPGYWPLIGQEWRPGSWPLIDWGWSHYQDTGLWLVESDPMTQILASYWSVGKGDWSNVSRDRNLTIYSTTRFNGWVSASQHPGPHITRP